MPFPAARARALVFLLAATSAAAQTPPPVRADVSIAAQPLEQALAAWSRQTGGVVAVDAALVAGRTARAVEGRYSPREALERLVAGTGLEVGGEAARPTLRAATTPAGAIVITGALDPTAPYAGGQVARGGQVGLLGDRDLFATPFNITSFTAQAIADTQSVRASDLLRFDPAVRVASNQTSFYADYTVRGFRVTGDAFTFDGLNGLIPSYAPSLLAAMERVEIIKGANALLVGAGSGLALGGTVNLVPKRGPNVPIAQLTLGYESDSRFNQHVDLGRRFGTDNAFGVRLNLYHSHGDASFDNEREDLKLGALSLDWRGDHARVSLDLSDTKQTTHASLGSVYLDPALGIAVPKVPKSGANYVQPFSFSETRPRFAVLRGEVDVGSALTAYAAYGWADNRYRQLLPFALVKNDRGDIDEIFQNGSGSDRNRGAEVGLRGRVATGPLQHQLALSAVRTRFGNDGYYVFDEASGTQPTVASNLYDPVRVDKRPDLFFRDRADWQPNNRNDRRSVALADTVSAFDERLFVTAGIRRQRVFGQSFDSQDGTPFEPYDKSAWTPAFAVLVKATPVVSLYANRIEALEDAPSPDENAVNRAQVFPPTRNRQTEAGVKADFGRVGATFDVFRIARPRGVLDPTTLVFGLDGKQRNTGAELSVFGEPLRGVRLNGGVAYVDAKLVKTQDGTFDGKRARSVPRTTASLSGEWDLPFAPGLTFAADVGYTGNVVLDDAGTLRIGSHTVLGAGARYRTQLLGRPLALRAGVTNVGDRRYWVGDVYGSFYQGAPRAVAVSATLDF